MNKTELINHLRKSNPYPIDIFPEPFEDGGWGDIGKFLTDNGYSSDRIFAKMGRMVWDNCINEIENLLEQC